MRPPRIFIPKSHLEPREFLITSAKRLLQQYLPLGDIRLAVVMQTAVNFIENHPGFMSKSGGQCRRARPKPTSQVPTPAGDAGFVISPCANECRTGDERVTHNHAPEHIFAPCSGAILLDKTAEGGSRPDGGQDNSDRKSTRLNSSHLGISYAVFCLK